MIFVHALISEVVYVKSVVVDKLIKKYVYGNIHSKFLNLVSKTSVLFFAKLTQTMLEKTLLLKYNFSFVKLDSNIA